MKLICHACKYEVAETRDLALPLTGAMFVSRDPAHGVPAPWSPVVTWEYMFCPMCQRRPFLDPAPDGTIIMNTDSGIIAVTQKGIVKDEDGDGFIDLGAEVATKPSKTATKTATKVAKVNK
jgi:hypothetical protein